jgi:hypothetical protein
MQHGVLVLEENAGVVEWRSGGVVEWWSNGVLEYWFTADVHHSITPPLRAAPRERSPSGERYFERLSVERNVFASRRALAHRCF